jgi:hypothetical protein
MNPLGKVVNDFLRQQQENDVHNASVVASNLQKEGMARGQAAEMLHAAGYEGETVGEALRRVFDQGGKEK